MEESGTLAVEGQVPSPGNGAGPGDGRTPVEGSPSQIAASNPSSSSCTYTAADGQEEIVLASPGLSMEITPAKGAESTQRELKPTWTATTTDPSISSLS